MDGQLIASRDNVREKAIGAYRLATPETTPLTGSPMATFQIAVDFARGPYSRSIAE